MWSSSIKNDEEYIRDISLARQITCQGRIDICPHYSYAFHADFELFFNSYFSNPNDRWILIFDEILPVISSQSHSNQNDNRASFTIEHSPNHYDIHHNTKLKFKCDFCGNEWTSMQGQISFRVLLPLLNPPFVLIVHLNSQQCKKCSRLQNPSCYLDEVTRIIKLTSRFIRQTFYYYRTFHCDETVDEHSQRTSQTQGRHQRQLCRACQQNSCWNSRRTFR